MLGKVGYKAWSGGNQLGLRVYADTIRRLRIQMLHPSQDGAFANLDEWLRVLESGGQPSRYSRPAVVMLPDRQLQHCTLTIATLPPKSPQGYVTAPAETPFAQLVRQNLGRDVEVDIESSQSIETLVLQPPRADLKVREQRSHAQRALRRLARPTHIDLVEQGMYFEHLEFEKRKAELGHDLTVDWRAPYIDSNLLKLREYGVSCDIDVWDRSGMPQLCIEVKSLAGAPTGAFVLTRREFESRDKCRTLGIPYEIVVYGFSRSGVDHPSAGPGVRRVIGPEDALNSEPDSYLCW